MWFCMLSWCDAFALVSVCAGVLCTCLPGLHGFAFCVLCCSLLGVVVVVQGAEAAATLKTMDFDDIFNSIEAELDGFL